MEVEEHVAVGLATGEHEPTTIITAEEAGISSVFPDAEVVGFSVADDTIKGYPPHSARRWDRRSGGLREEEPRELTRELGLSDTEPPIVAHHQHVAAVDGAW
jgi:hypothetical protein